MKHPPLPRRLALLLICGCGLICLLLALRVRFVLSVMQGESMEPSLHPGDVLLVDKRAYGNVSPSRGDIVITRYQNRLIVKRVVGLPGEEIEVKNGSLYINGSLLAEPHETRTGSLDVGRGTLLLGSFAILGDNRADTLSLAFNPVLQTNQIVGKVVYRVRLWPQTEAVRHTLRRPDSNGASSDTSDAG